MVRKTPDEKIEELEAAKAKIAARIKVEKNKLRKKNRKDETRRKILVGAVVLSHMQHNDEFAEAIMELLGKYTLRPADREFLKLPPLKSSKH